MRPQADLAAIYGIGVLGPIDHETRTGLYLNRTRQLLRQGVGVSSGLGAMLSPAPPLAWHLATHDSDWTALRDHARAEFEAEARASQKGP